MVHIDTSVLLLLPIHANFPSRPDWRTEQADPLLLQGGADGTLGPWDPGASGAVVSVALAEIMDVTG